MTTLEMKISYLAIIGTLGPMIGLVGTIWGMIMSFQEIATAAGAQPRPEKVAEGISTALFITLEGVSLSVPAIFFFAFFRNRIAQMTMEATRVADRTINSLVAAAKSGKTGLSSSRLSREMIAMSASMSTELKAEPNLTPLLDVVFQLITFFMLVINFSSENYDQRVRLPVAESAPAGRGRSAVSEDRLVLNVDRDGHLLIGGEVQPLHKAIQTIKHQADLVKLNLKAAGTKADPSGSLPTTIILRVDKDATFSLVDQPDQGVRVARVPEILRSRR